MVDFSWVAGFVLVFAVVGGFELFDRTSFALIVLSSRARPLATWVGGSAAFVASTIVAVTAGAALAAALGPSRVGWLRVAGGSFLIAYAIWSYLHPEAEEKLEAETRARSAFFAAFLTIFLLELGDTTQIFEIVFVTDWGWLIVLVAGSLALVTVAAWDVFLGQRLGARVEPALMRRIVVVVLLVVGAATILYGLAPGAFPTLSLAAPG
ncbi:MAG: TMEM165/GDT1 family protein [Thermoplasmata archaeon]|nr:TMEM165/GDT1 family protein [Thermoplasmata archaeon]